MRSRKATAALVVVLAGALSGCIAPSQGDPTISDISGTWCGEDGGRLVFSADGTMSGTELTPRFVEGLVQDLDDTPPSVGPSVSATGTWRLDNPLGMHQLLVDFASLVGVEPSTALEDALVLKGAPWTIISYAGDPDSDPGYRFTRCAAGSVSPAS